MQTINRYGLEILKKGNFSLKEIAVIQRFLNYELTEDDLKKFEYKESLEHAKTLKRLKVDAEIEVEFYSVRDQKEFKVKAVIYQIDKGFEGDMACRWKIHYKPIYPTYISEFRGVDTLIKAMSEYWGSMLGNTRAFYIYPNQPLEGQIFGKLNENRSGVSIKFLKNGG